MPSEARSYRSTGCTLPDAFTWGNRGARASSTRASAAAARRARLPELRLMDAADAPAPPPARARRAKLARLRDRGRARAHKQGEQKSRHQDLRRRASFVLEAPRWGRAARPCAPGRDRSPRPPPRRSRPPSTITWGRIQQWPTEAVRRAARPRRARGATPIMPPAIDSASASIRNWVRMSNRRAPTAMRRPISRVRSVTLTSMMFMMPMPPTSSDTAAIAGEQGGQRLGAFLLRARPSRSGCGSRSRRRRRARGGGDRAAAR